VWVLACMVWLAGCPGHSFKIMSTRFGMHSSAVRSTAAFAAVMTMSSAKFSSVSPQQRKTFRPSLLHSLPTSLAEEGTNSCKTMGKEGDSTESLEMVQKFQDSNQLRQDDNEEIGELILPSWNVKQNISIDSLTPSEARKLLDSHPISYSNWGDFHIRKTSKLTPIDVLLQEIGCIPDTIRQEFLSDEAEEMRKLLSQSYSSFDDFKEAYNQLTRRRAQLENSKSRRSTRNKLPTNVTVGAVELPEDLLVKIFCGNVGTLQYWQDHTVPRGIYEYIIKPSEGFENYRLIVPTNTLRDAVRNYFPKNVINVLDLNYIPSNEKNEKGEQLIRYSKLWEGVVASRVALSIRMHKDNQDDTLPFNSLFGRNTIYLSQKTLPTEFMMPVLIRPTKTPYLMMPKGCGIFHCPNGIIEVNDNFVEGFTNGSISFQDVGVVSFEFNRDHPIADLALLLHDGSDWHLILISVKGSKDGIGPSLGCVDRVSQFLSRDLEGIRKLQKQLGDVKCSLGYIVTVDGSPYSQWKLESLLEQAEHENKLKDTPVFIVHDMQDFLPSLGHRIALDYDEYENVATNRGDQQHYDEGTIFGGIRFHDDNNHNEVEDGTLYLTS
jgi:hypothetical protein